MKRTHLSVGVYDQSWRHRNMGPIREKHNTACGTICDKTKATTEPAKVTCQLCRRKRLAQIDAILAGPNSEN